MSERQLTQAALLVANYMTQEQHDSEVGTWGYYTKSAFRKFLDTVQITDVLREHLNSGVYHYVDELPTEVATALLAHGNDEVTTEGSQEPAQEPEHNSEQQEPEQEPETETQTEEPVAETVEEPVAEENAETESETTEEETSEEKPKARRSRRS